MSWHSERYAVETNIAYFEQVIGICGDDGRSLLDHAERGLESWDAAVGRVRHRADGVVPPTECLDWAVCAFSTTLHNVIVEALQSVDLNDYSDGAAEAIACSATVITGAVRAWRVLLRDLIAARNGSGQPWDFDDYRSLAEQASATIEGVRNSVTAAYR